MRNCTLNNFNKYSVKKKYIGNLDEYLYLLIYVSWSASQAYLIVYILYTY